MEEKQNREEENMKNIQLARQNEVSRQWNHARDGGGLEGLKVTLSHKSHRQKFFISLPFP